MTNARLAMGSESGQALVEMALVLLFTVAMSITALRIFPPALGGLYRNLSEHRAGIKGMLP